jgi:hypothetical protein
MAVAFDLIGKGSAGAVGRADNVTVSYVLADERSSRYALAFRFGAAVLSRLVWTPLADRVCIFEGRGPDAGLLKIVRAAGGQRPSYALSGHGSRNADHGAIKISIGMLRHHYVEDSAHPQTEVEFQAFGGEALILLPQWVIRAGQPA